MLRIDHEKFTVFQRNSCIAELASSSIGSASSQIYSKILQLLEKGTKQCREEPGSPGAVADPDEELNTYGLPRLQTRDIRAIVTDKVELADAIGHADRSKIDMAQFDHPKKRRRKDSSTANGDVKMAKVDGHASSDESEGSEDDQGNVTDVDSDPQIPDEIEEDFDFNPINIVSRKRKRSARPKGPPSPLREHLFLLANQPRPFLHHLPANRSMHESWSVDFHGLSRHLLIDSLFQIIMNRFGSLATRLIRILHEKVS